MRVGAGVTRRSYAVALERAQELRTDRAPLRDESLPGKHTTSFTCSGLGRFLNGAASRAAQWLLTDFTL